MRLLLFAALKASFVGVQTKKQIDKQMDGRIKPSALSSCYAVDNYEGSNSDYGRGIRK